MKVLITGASRGLGQAMALRIARAGTSIALCASAPSAALEATAAQCRSRGAQVPLHRIGDPERDCSGVVQFLLSGDASYISGQNLVVDGGLLGSIQRHLAGRPMSGGQ